MDREHGRGLEAGAVAALAWDNAGSEPGRHRSHDRAPPLGLELLTCR